MTEINRQWRLAKRPEGMPGPDDWQYAEEDLPKIEAEEVLLKTLYISLDPAMRGWMSQARSYVPPVKIGAVMRASAISQVIESKHPQFKKNDFVTGLQGVQTHAKSNGNALTKIDPDEAPLSRYLGILGIPGMTAYFGMLEVGRPRPGETVLVSGAAGATGAAAAQIAKIHGCRTVGIAGGEEKRRYLIEDLGLDGAIDYKTEDTAQAIRKHFRKGVDVYFDNVGGDILEAALANISRGARIVLCGAISQYNNEKTRGPSNYLALLVYRARMEGFVVFDYAERYPEAREKIAGWMREGKLIAREHIEEGIENFPGAFRKLFTGENFGKLILKVAEAES